MEYNIEEWGRIKQGNRDIAEFLGYRWCDDFGYTNSDEYFENAIISSIGDPQQVQFENPTINGKPIF